MWTLNPNTLAGILLGGLFGVIGAWLNMRGGARSAAASEYNAATAASATVGAAEIQERIAEVKRLSDRVRELEIDNRGLTELNTALQIKVGKMENKIENLERDFRLLLSDRGTSLSDTTRALISSATLVAPASETGGGKPC